MKRVYLEIEKFVLQPDLKLKVEYVNLISNQYLKGD